MEWRSISRKKTITIHERLLKVLIIIVFIIMLGVLIYGHSKYKKKINAKTGVYDNPKITLR